MVTALIYIISSIIIGLFSYKCYSVGYGKKKKNPFANYLYLSSLFITLSYLSGGILTALTAYTYDNKYLEYYNFLARALFYMSAVFAAQVPLYKFFPNDKRRWAFSYLAGLVGIALLYYQYFYTNMQPSINAFGIVNWDVNIVLAIGMMFVMFLPWLATSIIFFSEFIKSRFSSPKLFLLGYGFFLIVTGGFFTDNFISDAVWYIVFSIVMVTGFLFCLAGMYYEDSKY